eukprot:g20202.t1
MQMMNNMNMMMANMMGMGGMMPGMGVGMPQMHMTLGGSQRGQPSRLRGREVGSPATAQRSWRCRAVQGWYRGRDQVQVSRSSATAHSAEPGDVLAGMV